MTFIRTLVPAPLLSASLLALWLLLARSVGVGEVLIGLVLALVVPILTAQLRPTKASVRRPLLIVRYLLTIIVDVVSANFEVAWSLLRWRSRRPQAKFVIVPLQLRDPLGLAVLSMVTTIVPGTVWSELALDRSALLLHVWDVGDEDRFITRFKARYEAPLREIFE